MTPKKVASFCFPLPHHQCHHLPIKVGRPSSIFPLDLLLSSEPYICTCAYRCTKKIERFERQSKRRENSSPLLHWRWKNCPWQTLNAKTHNKGGPQVRLGVAGHTHDLSLDERVIMIAMIGSRHGCLDFTKSFGRLQHHGLNFRHKLPLAVSFVHSIDNIVNTKLQSPSLAFFLGYFHLQSLE